MSQVMDEEIKRWTARRKSALVLEIIQGKTTVAEASRQFDLTPSEIESWVDEGKRGMENALRAKPEDVREQYERQLKDLQEAYGEAMLELRARKKGSSPKSGERRPDLEEEVGIIAVAICDPLDDLDLVVDALDQVGSQRPAAVGEDAGQVGFQTSHEYLQRFQPATERRRFQSSQARFAQPA